MKSRQIGIVLGVVVIVAAIVTVARNNNDDVSNAGHNAAAQPAALSTDNEISFGQSSPQNSEVSSVELDAQPDTGEQIAAGVNGSQLSQLEKKYLYNQSFDIQSMDDLRQDTEFQSLVANMQQQTDPVASEMRRTYEGLFYSLGPIMDGRVSLDVLECGVQLCASEFRSSDPSAIDQFVQDATKSDDFGSKAVMHLTGVGPSGQSHRLLFAHDPSIEGLTLPADLLFQQATSK
ncbi:MAG: hypothetical protein AAF351_02010 [Pseudomonadota bacterium]